MPKRNVMDTSKDPIHIASPAMDEEELEALRQPIESGWLTQGPRVAEFEEQFARMHDVDHALAVTSATTGLHLALKALGIGPGDEVIVPAFTWVSTVNVVMYVGATPVFVDVDPVTFNISVEGVAVELTDRTRAIIPVHLFGLCADIDGLAAVLPDSVAIVEDAACAAGGNDKGRPAGSMGSCGVFSFHPRKSITTGEGGMITTANHELAERVSILRNHGASISEEARHVGPRPYLLPDFSDLGFNYRMTDLQGAIGLVQLSKLDTFIDERARWADYYRRELSGINWLTLPQDPENGRHAWQAFVTYVDPDAAPMSRNEIMQHLQDLGIATRPGTHAVHMLNFYKTRFGFQADDFPNAAACDRNTMAVPLHNRMTENDYARVVEALSSLSGNSS